MDRASTRARFSPLFYPPPMHTERFRRGTSPSLGGPALGGWPDRGTLGEHRVVVPGSYCEIPP